MSLDSVMKLQKELIKYPQVEVRTRHYFADGMYCREVWRPAGTVIVGKVHKKEHFLIIAEGEVTISDGIESKAYYAPAVIVSKPGTKRATYSRVAATLITVWRAEPKAIGELERELCEDDEDCQYLPGNLLPEALLK